MSKDITVANHFLRARGIKVRWMDVDNAVLNKRSLPDYLRMKHDLYERDRRVHGVT